MHGPFFIDRGDYLFCPVAGERAAGAEVTVELLKIRLGPVCKTLRLTSDDRIDSAVRLPIERADACRGRKLEQFVGRNAQPDGQPMHAGYPVADNVGGLFGAVGVLAALLHRARNPGAPGEEIDLSLVESTLKLLEFLPIEHQQLGTVRQRSGNASQYSAPSAVFLTQDEHWVTLAGSTNPLFAANCRAIGRPELAADPRFASNGTRVQHGAELNALFGHWIAQRPLAEVLVAFDAAGGTVAPIYGIDQIAADPQMQARQALCDVPDDDFGSVQMATVVPRFAGNPGAIRHSGGALGQHNRAVYIDELGLTEAELQALIDAVTV